MLKDRTLLFRHLQPFVQALFPEHRSKGLLLSLKLVHPSWFWSRLAIVKVPSWCIQCSREGRTLGFMSCQGTQGIPPLTFVTFLFQTLSSTRSYAVKKYEAHTADWSATLIVLMSSRSAARYSYISVLGSMGNVAVNAGVSRVLVVLHSSKMTKILLVV
jgi:hypothetical protein